MNSIDEHAISRFWKTFESGARELAKANSADGPAYESLLSKLQEIHSGLYLEFSVEDGSSELIVTADGDLELFPLVDQVVSLAPRIENWSVFALKPKLGFPVTATWGGHSVRIEDVVFDPLECGDPTQLGVRLLVPGLQLDHVEHAHNALLRVLDHGLGEREFASAIQHTEVCSIPAEGKAEDFIPLVQLGDYLEWRLRKQDDSA